MLMLDGYSFYKVQNHFKVLYFIGVIEDLLQVRQVAELWPEKKGDHWGNVHC